MRLILVRHGQTDYNLNRRFQGQREVPLNPTGMDQAERLASRFASLKVDALCSSDLRRCIQTAEVIAKRVNLPVLPDARWRELSFGDWEGMTHAEIQAAAPQWLIRWEADPAGVSPPNGETVTQLAGRAASALDELRRQHAGQTVLLITHGGVIRAVLCHVLGIDLNRHWQFEVGSASVSEISFYGDGAVIQLFNDASHLQEQE
ncbi:MAG: alpha-ribazole phosphatase [Chloroflexi bacterium]|nr:alpha-ribazole phosphatase [Chloroflexota bacterium]